MGQSQAAQDALQQLMQGLGVMQQPGASGGGLGSQIGQQFGTQFGGARPSPGLFSPALFQNLLTQAGQQPGAAPAVGQYAPQYQALMGQLQPGAAAMPNLPGVFNPPNIPAVTQADIQGALTGNTPVNQLVGQVANNAPNLGNAGPALDPMYLPPTGPVEQALFSLFQQGPSAFGGPNNQFIGSLSQGQIPAAQMQQFNEQWARQQAAMNENFRGARYGSDFGRTLGREYGSSLNDLLVNAQKQALAAEQQQEAERQNAINLFLGNAYGLMGQETARGNVGFQTLMQDLARLGSPNELYSYLISLIGSTGGQGVGALPGGDTWGGVAADAGGTAAAGIANALFNRNPAGTTGAGWGDFARTLGGL